MDMRLKGLMRSLNAKPGQVVSDPYARAFASPTQIREDEDHEVFMANSTLDSIIKSATELKAKLGTAEKDIPAWIQDHIANSENYISQANKGFYTIESVNETKFYAFWNGKKSEIDGKDLWDAKQKAISQLNVPKSKVGLLAVVNAADHDKGSFVFN